MLSREDLEKLGCLNIVHINTDELQELTEIVIDESSPIEERLKLFLQDIKNPFCFKVDGTAVQITFSDTERTLDEALKSYLTNLKNLDK